MTQPLSSLLVLDLGQMLAGPGAARMLGDLGARVIKVEPPGKGCPLRHVPPIRDGRSVPFMAANTGKQSIALNLQDDADRQIFDALLARADVLIDSQGESAMARQGYGWSVLHNRHPALICGAVTGYGDTGPDARHPASDLIAQARSGALLQSGAHPVARPASADIAAAHYLTQGILAALLERGRSGLGTRIEVSLLDAQFAMLGQDVAMAAANGQSRAPHPTRSPTMAPCESFAAADGMFAMAVTDDAMFERLCMTLTLPLSGDPRFATNAARVQNARLLKRLIEAVTLGAPTGDWIARLTAAGIAVAHVATPAQALRDGQLTARHMLVDLLDRNGRVAGRAVGNPVKQSEAEDRLTRAAAPDLDAHRGEILRWLAQTDR